MDLHVGDPASRRSGPRPRRIATLVPALVALAVLGLLGWSAWPVLRPARHVTVVQAVFDRSGSTQPEAAAGAAAREVPTVQAPGWLEAEPFHVACTALADGVIESIEVLEGDRVERGAVVARLVADDARLGLRRAEAELATAEAALAMARAEHQAARRGWEAPVALERAVEAGTAALAEREAERARLPLLVESARATLVRLDEEAERVRRSSEQRATSELELIVAEQRAAAQRSDVAALQARGPILDARVERLGAELRAARRDLELRIEDRRRLDVAAAAVASAESAVERARVVRDEAALELERMDIRAPIAGYVQRRVKIPGDKVVRMMDSRHSTHVLYLYDPDRIQVRVDVPLADASHVSIGQPCEVVVEVLPNRVFRGVVLRTAHEADLQKNTLQVKVKIIDPDPMLRPEMLTRVKFLPPPRPGGPAAPGPDGAGAQVLVPSDAVEDGPGSPRVWLVTDRRGGRGTLSARQVSVVQRSDAWVTVAGDVQPGALIALGVEQPREGEIVRVRGSREGVSP